MVLKKKLFWINLLLLFDHKPAPIIFLPRSQLISTHTWQRPCWGCHSRGQTVPPAVRMSGSSGPAYRLWRLSKRGPGIRGSNTKITHPIGIHPVTSEYKTLKKADSWSVRTKKRLEQLDFFHSCLINVGGWYNGITTLTILPPAGYSYNWATTCPLSWPVCPQPTNVR